MSDDGLSPAERARQALAQAREDARRRGAPPRRQATGERRPPARRARREDPQPLDAALSDLLAERGWRRRAAVGEVFGRWPQIVGAELAAHTRPASFDDGVVVVAAESPAWATQMRLLAAELVRRLNEELGEGTVRRVAVICPTRRGPLSQPGGYD